MITQSQRFGLGFDPASGDLLWQISYVTAWDQNSVTPVVDGDTVIFSGIDKGITAFRIVHNSNTWQAQQVWHNADLSMYMNSPILDGHLLYGLAAKNKGHYFCIDARNGETLWTSPGRQGDNASIIDAGDKLLLFNTDAQLIIADKSDTNFTEYGRHTIAQSPTWAHPAVLDGRLLIKDTTHLYLWSAE